MSKVKLSKSQRRKLVSFLNKFMWAKRKILEDYFKRNKEVREVAKDYWRRKDRELLEELSDEELMQAVKMIWLHVRTKKPSFLTSKTCPFCIAKYVREEDCDTCSYGAQKGICINYGSVWFTLYIEGAPVYDYELLYKVWEMSNGDAVIESMKNIIKQCQKLTLSTVIVIANVLY